MEHRQRERGVGTWRGGAGYLVQTSDSFHALDIRKLGPVAEQLAALGDNARIGEMEVPQTRRRSSKGSSAKVRWKRGPAFWMRPSSKTSARSCRWTLPYLSFLRIARAASAGPVVCGLITSTRSGIPLRSSTSCASLVSVSTKTVTDVYGFFCVSPGGGYLRQMLPGLELLVVKTLPTWENIAARYICLLPI